MEQEVWKVLPEHPGYSISNLGRVRGPRGLYNCTPNNSGYPVFKITLGGKEKSLLVHRTVCRLFNGEPPFQGAHALHNNHDRSNCRADNLHWGSDQDNMDEMYAAGRGRKASGENNGSAVLTWEKVREIRKLWHNGKNQSELGRLYKVSTQTIHFIVRNKTWKEPELCKA